MHLTFSKSNKTIDLSQPCIMGILNLTPDSFSDGGLFLEQEKALTHVKNMIHDGAQIIDIGGESTRPGAKNVSLNDELGRVIPVIKAIRKFSDCLISVDTSKADVMREAIQAGANIINDVRALQEDDRRPHLALVAEAREQENDDRRGDRS